MKIFERVDQRIAPTKINNYYYYNGNSVGRNDNKNNRPMNFKKKWFHRLLKPSLKWST